MKKIVIAIVSIIVILVTILTNKYYQEFKFYKSDRFKYFSNNIDLHLQAYYYTYCSYPKSGELFLEFLMQDSLYFKNTGSDINSSIFRNGIDIKVSDNDSSVIVYSNGFVKSLSFHNDYFTPDELDFLSYLFSGKHILISKIPYSPCCYNIPNNLLIFQKGHPIDLDNSIQDTISFLLKQYTIDSSHYNLIWIKPQIEKTIYYKIVMADGIPHVISLCKNNTLIYSNNKKLQYSLERYIEEETFPKDFDSLYFKFKVIDYVLPIK